jgi:hypothetical protein
MLMSKPEYEAMVSRVRKHYGPSVEIGGFNSYDIRELNKKAALADQEKASERESRPINEAGTRLHKTRERVQKALKTIADGQATLAQSRRLHVINGVDPELLETVAMPRWDTNKTLSTVAEYDAANTEAAELATKLETQASKMRSYVSQWEHSTPEQQNRFMILALADRLDRMEQEKGEA